MGSLLARLARRLLRDHQAAPPIDRRADDGLWIFYGAGQVDELRTRLQNVLVGVPNARVIADDTKLTKALHRRTGWRRIAKTVRPGDAVVFADPLSLGPVWRANDRTFEGLARLPAHVIVALSDGTAITVSKTTADAELERIRNEARQFYSRQRLQAAMNAVRAAGRWVGRPPLAWTSRDGRLIPNVDDLAVIRQICERHERGETLQAIGADLEARSIRVHDGSRWNARRLGRAYNFGCELGWGSRRRRPWDLAKERLAMRA